MLMNKNDAESRLNSPVNLINRLRGATEGAINNSNKIITIPATAQENAKVPSAVLTIPPEAESLVIDLKHKIKLAGVKGKAVDVLDGALDELANRVHDIENVSKLGTIADIMNRIANGADGKANHGHMNQLVIWQPIMIQENHYESIQVSE